MKAIKIQNCTDFKDKFFNLIVNGEMYVMRHKFLTVFIADDKPFEVKVEYLGSSSPVYTFEPKENLSLQVFTNRRLIKTALVLLIAGMFLGLVIGYFYENARFISFVPPIAMSIVPIHQIIRRKKFFVIREVLNPI